MKRQTMIFIFTIAGVLAWGAVLIIHSLQIARLRHRVELLEWIEKPMPVPTVLWPTNIVFEVQGEATDTNDTPARRSWKTK